MKVSAQTGGEYYQSTRDMTNSARLISRWPKLQRMRNEQSFQLVETIEMSSLASYLSMIVLYPIQN